MQALTVSRRATQGSILGLTVMGKMVTLDSTLEGMEILDSILDQAVMGRMETQGSTEDQRETNRMETQGSTQGGMVTQGSMLA